MYLPRFLTGVASRRATLLGASAIAMSLAASTAYAQTTGSGPPKADTSQAVTELVITATRREAVNALQVPLAVDAYAGRTLERLDITSESDLAKLDPSLNIQTYGPAEQRIIIRGVSSVVGAT